MKMKWKMSAARAAPPHDWKIAVAAQRLAAHGMGKRCIREKGVRSAREKRARSSHVLRMRSLPHAQSDTTP